MLQKWLCVGLLMLMFCLGGCGAGNSSTEDSEDVIALLPTDESDENPSTRQETEVPESQVTLPEKKLAESEVIIPEMLPSAPSIIIPEMKPTVEVVDQEHSEYYIPGLDADTLIQYFNEVVLDAEFVNSGNASVVQKWDRKVLYYIYGEPTDKDWQFLRSMEAWLNSIYGFPGMEETQNEVEANMQIYFTDYDGMIDVLGTQYKNSDGGLRFWFNNNRIYRGIICYRTDIDQYIRNSVVMEEIYNGMGPVQDTNLRKDSLIYAGYSLPQFMTEIDKLIMTLLYHPDIDYGMNTEECAAVIRQLYY